MFDPSLAFLIDHTQQDAAILKKAISPNYCVEESTYIRKLHSLAVPDDEELARSQALSRSIISTLRSEEHSVHLIDKLLLEYSLEVEEGVILMCLAEALLRIPDKETADALIKDKLSDGDWLKHLGHSDSTFVNAATWGLLLGSRYVLKDPVEEGTRWQALLARIGSKLTRQALRKAMAIMGEHFVLGESIDSALTRAQLKKEMGQCYSFDMLGEAALSQEDADAYFKAYEEAIYRIGKANQQQGTLRHSISIKLSALHPRYEERQRARVLDELFKQVLSLVSVAKANNVAITIDAEEQDRLELYLDLIEKLLCCSECQGWGQLGVVIQAYSKRALPTLVWLNALARENSTQIPVRLVKGAYWDSEIKLAQQQGMLGYPVFTLKPATDLSYLVCARYLLSNENRYLQPQFASHNVNSIAVIRVLAEHFKRPMHTLEFQRLHGMGEALHQLNQEQTQSIVRAYAPVGSHVTLLPYLVRRLLENGANSSFVHNLVDRSFDDESLVSHPYEEISRLITASEQEGKSFEKFLLSPPSELFGLERRNSQGLNLAVEQERTALFNALSMFDGKRYFANTLCASEDYPEREVKSVSCSFRREMSIGELALSSKAVLDTMFADGCRAFEAWRMHASEERAMCLDRMANLLESHRSEIIYLCQVESGKTLTDAVDEVREAVDFCRYYSVEARRLFSKAMALKGPVGEDNYLSYSGRGVFVCISPWNFPVAIFTGQIAAALVSGNCVIAKPAEHASLLAYFCTQLWYKAGVPKDVLQLVLARSAELGDTLTSDEPVAGVAFTGSTSVAKQINLNLANKPGPIVPFIAETGGQNAMIVDSTALAEQVVRDVIHSAFNSAGQRCSALRVFYVQDDVFQKMVHLLVGAMKELVIGSPCELNTDVGPVISSTAKRALEQHVKKLEVDAIKLFQCDLKDELKEENYVAPCLFQIKSLEELDQENFGPVLHLISYSSKNLDRVIMELNNNPYGLTLGIHSRNHSFINYIEERVHVGNIYINRNQVGAVVGVQPFGGEKLSGTGPKAGGPNYLMRFVTEHTHCENTAAMGGNPHLLSAKKSEL